MNTTGNENLHGGLYWSLFVFVLLFVILLFPYGDPSSASGRSEGKKKGLVQKTTSQQAGLEYYDIRLVEKEEAAVNALARFRSESGRSASFVADRRDDFVRGEENLRSRVKTLKVEYNRDMRIPEVITPDYSMSGFELLSAPSKAKRSEILRAFARENRGLIGLRPTQVQKLEVLADYTNPAGNLSFAHLGQKINGIPVFRGEIKAGFTKNGEMVRVINNLAPGLDYGRVSKDFGDPLTAVRVAAANIRYRLQSPDVTKNEKRSTDRKAVFGNGDWATTAEKMYFPIEPGVARAAWRVLIWQPVNAFYVIVDGATGTVLWRKNITEDQTQSVTLEVYRNATAFMDVADSPAPLSPGPIDPSLGTQGAILARANVTLIGNEGNLSFNNNGWVTDGANGTDGHTDGNAVEAGVDLGAPDGVDAVVAGTGRVFSTAWNPPPGNPGPGDAPTVQAARDGAVIQMFYVTNRYHDSMYLLGFTEPARNFQADNFGRGGNATDRVSAEGQDSSGTDNANFSTPSDGGRGRMQMFVFTNTGVQRDGTTDAEVIVHELTHGTSNRLHGNAAGLNQDMARGMGEGWSDFYAWSLLSESTDPINAIYSQGSYVTFMNFGLGTTNSYYGIRSLPQAVMAFTGGAMNRPHNSLTFADVDSTTADNSDAAFSAAFGPNFNSPHFRGEVWVSALWEVRALMINRLGFAAGNQRALQVVTDGMKLAPIDPTFLQERDAIIAAAAALPFAPEAQADVDDVKEGFRIRGMAFDASVQGTAPVRVTESFNFLNAVHVDPFSVSDSIGNNNGFPEPGENVLLSVPVNNTTGSTVNNVTANVNGGPNVAYGNIADAATVTNQILYTVPSSAACGGVHQVTINVGSDLGAQQPVTRSFSLGQTIGTTENFDGVADPNLPANWTSSLTGAGSGWVSRTTNPNSGVNSVFADDVPAVGQSILETPATIINSASAVLRFKADYDLEDSVVTPNLAFDGFVLEIKIGAGAYQDIITAGGSFLKNGYDHTISSCCSNPLAGRDAWSDDTAGYVEIEAQLPAAANGQSVQVRWILGTDNSVLAPGLDIDDVEFITSFNCAAPGNKRADFDGDGRTDISVFRPSTGVWYLNQSTDGFAGIAWGMNGDTLVPGDYDGDGKTDSAVFRPTNTPGTADFFILNSNGFTVTGAEWGIVGDLPVVADYDNDGKDDISVWRPTDGTWYIINSNGGPTGIEPFGQAGDIPVIGDWDGDGKVRPSVFRPSDNTWYLAKATGTAATNFDAVPFGLSTDSLVPGDYDGDGKTDVAVWRPTDGTWYVLNSGTGSVSFTPFGTNGDVPVPGDYDGDGKDDPSIFRAGEWWTLNSGDSSVSASVFGLGSDLPIPASAGDH